MDKKVIQYELLYLKEKVKNYENEFNSSSGITTSKPSPSFDNKGNRFNTDTKFGVGMYGIKPKGFFNRMKKSRNITN